MPSPIRTDRSGRKYYARAGGAYNLSKGTLKKVGSGKGKFSMRNSAADSKRRATKRRGKTGRDRYPQSYD